MALTSTFPEDTANTCDLMSCEILVVDRHLRNCLNELRQIYVAINKPEETTSSLLVVLREAYTRLEASAHQWLDIIPLNDRNFPAIGLTGSASLISRIPAPAFKHRHQLSEYSLLEEILSLVPLETMTLMADRFAIEGHPMRIMMARAQADPAFRPLVARLSLTDWALEEANMVWYLGDQKSDSLSVLITECPDIAPRVLARQMEAHPRLKKHLMDLATMHAKLPALSHLIWCGLCYDEVENFHNRKETAEFLEGLKSGHGRMNHMRRGDPISRVARTPWGGPADPL